jgi:adenosylhomocysteine nucleosidase
VLNVGTAGALDASLHGLCEVDVVTQHDFPYVAVEALTGAATTARAYQLSAHAPPRAAAALTGRRVLATGDTFVSDAATALELAGRGIHLVDMEAYGFASTCAAFGVPMRCAKAVSDRADADAADSWIDRLDACARELADWVSALRQQ